MGSTWLNLCALASMICIRRTRYARHRITSMLTPHLRELHPDICNVFMCSCVQNTYTKQFSYFFACIHIHKYIYTRRFVGLNIRIQHRNHVPVFRSEERYDKCAISVRIIRPMSWFVFRTNASEKYVNFINVHNAIFGHCTFVVFKPRNYLRSRKNLFFLNCFFY